ncbi:hypothetical protein SDC9_124329 [bioreactor metagenome]|uniref:Uncharacterized protein n=1 Tax=bioreactor metagenome TaxID=1076179 RepID=A0A645CK40_9ZZZZ
MGDIDVALLDPLNRHLPLVNLDELRTFLKLLGQLHNGRGHRRRQKHHLPLFGCIYQNGFDIFLKAHVQHLIGFIQNDHF